MLVGSDLRSLYRNYREPTKTMVLVVKGKIPCFHKKAAESMGPSWTEDRLKPSAQQPARPQLDVEAQVPCAC